MKKLLLIIAVAALTAVGASSARAQGIHLSIGLPFLPSISVGIGGCGYPGYPGYGCAYPGYGYAYGYPAPVYRAVPAYAPPAVVYHQPYYAPYYGYGYGYGPRVYVAPHPWGGYGWGHRVYYRHY